MSMSDPHLFDAAKLSAALEGIAAKMERFLEDPGKGWTEGWERGLVELEPENRLSYRVLLTERLIGQGAVHTATFLIELGLQTIYHFEKSASRRSGGFFQGIEQAVQIFNQGLTLFRQVPDWRKNLEQTYLNLRREPEARKVFSHAVRENFEVVLPKIHYQPYGATGRAGLPLACSASGTEVKNVLTDCRVYWMDRTIQKSTDLEAIVRPSEKELVLIAPKIHPQSLQNLAKYTHRNCYALEVRAPSPSTRQALAEICDINFSHHGKWRTGRASAVSLDPSQVTILGIKEPRVLAPRRCLLSGLPEPEPAWHSLDNSFRTFRHSFTSGLADSQTVRQSIRFLQTKIPDMPRNQAAGAQAVVAAASKLLPLVSNEPVSVPAVAFAANNASVAVRDLFLGSKPVERELSRTAEPFALYLTSHPTPSPPAPVAEGGGDAPGGGPPPGDPRDGGEIVDRYLDVLLTGEVCPNKPVVLTATIRMPKSSATGQFKSSEFSVMVDSRVTFRVAFAGFLLNSAPSVERQVPREHDSEPATFIFLAQESETRWIEVSLFESESNRMLAQVTVSNFALECIEKRQIIRRADSVDLMISIGKDLLISADSPRERENLAGVDLGSIGALRQGWQEELDKQVTALYRQKPEDVERELRILGAEIADSLPQDLRQVLARGRVRTLLIRHTVDNSFPFELALLNGPQGEFFLADRVAVCRWIRGIPSAPTWERKSVRRAALLKGSIDLVQQEMDTLQTVCCQTEGFGSPLEIRQQVFRTRSFQLLHFFGHCRYQNNPDLPQDLYLELAEGQLRLREIGALEDESTFFAESPIIVLNACGAAAPRYSLFGEDSFPSRFLSHNASFFLGTQWPVEETVAHAFAEKFYLKLKAGTSVGMAMLEAKHELVGAESELSGAQKAWAVITLRAYTLFAHPEMSISFESEPS